jgi:arsenite methyltransferase
MNDASDPNQYAKSLGYLDEELRGVPEGLACHGCGNPVALAELPKGAIVLDLGSGGGLDVFLAAQRVGATGRVIGVDSSADMVAKATAAAAKNGYTNVEFKVGRMEDLPLEDESLDVVISNCVINHASDKLAVFKELVRCLRPGGKLTVTDLVTEGEFSQAALEDDVWGDWLRVATGKEAYLSSIREAGFGIVLLVTETIFPMAEQDERLKGKIVSIAFEAYK